MVYKCICRETREIGTTDVFVKIDGHYYKSQEVYNKYIERINKKISGIYSITNTINGFIYVGESMDVYRRWDEHINDLSNNKHSNYLLQNDFNNFEFENFKFDILQEHKAASASATKSQLLMLEHKYIKRYEMNNKSLYNLEYSLNKILNNDKCMFQKSGVDPKLLSILVGQIASYKIIKDGEKFKIIKRLTPITAYKNASGFKSCTRSDDVFRKCMNILKSEYKEDLDKIIKISTLKYKNQYDCECEKKIEEVTNYGITIFKEIVDNNTLLQKRKISKTREMTGEIALSTFINNIALKLNYEIPVYYSIRDWLMELGLIKLCDNHMYISELSASNNFLFPKRKLYDEKHQVEYFTILVSESCQNYIYTLLHEMSDIDKRELFYKPVIDTIFNQ